MRSLVLLLLLAAGCGQLCLTEDTRKATGWADAEQLFRGDQSWRGGDGAYSIDLGQGRVLWLFGDSFVSPGGNRGRSGAPFARNTIALQHGQDPASATLDFHYQRDSQGMPSAYFAADTPGTWLWPGPGARLGDVLVLFLWRMKSTGGGAFGFANDAPEARLIANPDDDPALWRMMPVAVPQNPWGVFLGTGAVVVEDGYFHALSCVEPGNHDVYAARWPIGAARQGQLDDPEWATGIGTWVHQSLLKDAPMRLFTPGHTEFSVHFDPSTQRYVQLQATGFPGDLKMRTAPSLTGPWSAQRDVYHPPELSCPGVFTYAGKAHPELLSPALQGRVAVTYASNRSDFFSLVRDQSLYFPRFVRLDVAAGLASP